MRYFIPECPFKKGAPCHHYCALSVWEREKGIAYCAFAMTAVVGREPFSINALRLPREVLEKDDNA